MGKTEMKDEVEVKARLTECPKRKYCPLWRNDSCDGLIPLGFDASICLANAQKLGSGGGEAESDGDFSRDKEKTEV